MLRREVKASVRRRSPMLPYFARRHSQALRQETARGPNGVRHTHWLGFIRTSPVSFTFAVQRKLVPRKPVQRKLICLAVAFNLLLWPGPGLASKHILSFASQVLSPPVGFSNS